MRFRFAQRTMIWIAVVGVVASVTGVGDAALGQSEPGVIEARKVPDDSKLQIFPIHERWAKAKAVNIPLRNTSGVPYSTRVRVAYSDTGLYVSIEVEDTQVTSTLDEDYTELWKEDVVGLFLWPNQNLPVYLEYLISPRGKELLLMVVSREARVQAWRPWPDEPEHRVQKAWMAIGPNGPTMSPENGASIEAWSVELFIPFALLEPLIDDRPEAGDQWRVNFGRLDFDEGKAATWSWHEGDGSFHDLTAFGVLAFK